MANPTNLTEYWKLVEALLQNPTHVANAAQDPELARVLGLLREMVNKGAGLEAAWVPSRSDGEAIAAMDKQIGEGGVPNLTSEAMIAFAKEYLELLNLFPAMSKHKLINPFMGPAKEAVVQKAKVLKERIENFKAPIDQKVEQLQVELIEAKKEEEQAESLSEQELQDAIKKLEEQRHVEQGNVKEAHDYLAFFNALHQRVKAHKNSQDLYGFSEEEPKHIYADLKGCLTPDDQAKWNKNEELLLSWTNWAMSFVVKREQPIPAAQLLGQFIEQGQAKAKASQEVAKNALAAIEKKLEPLHERLNAKFAPKPEAPKGSTELSVRKLTRRERIEAELERLGKGVQKFLQAIVESLDDIIKDVAKFDHQVESTIHEKIFGKPLPLPKGFEESQSKTGVFSLKGSQAPVFSR